VKLGELQEYWAIPEPTVKVDFRAGGGKFYFPHKPVDIILTVASIECRFVISEPRGVTPGWA
jgi:hypothetical protein